MCCLVYAGLEGTGAENNVSIFIRLRSAYYVHAFVFILFRQNQYLLTLGGAVYAWFFVFHPEPGE